MRSWCMNPNVDLTSFSRAAVPASNGAAMSGATLVAPPNRFATRYLLPGILLAGFLGLAAYAFRGTWQHPIIVRVVSPVLAAMSEDGPGAVGSETSSAATGTTESKGAEKVSAGAGAPWFQAPGWVEPSPLPIMIAALIGGNIKSVNVLEG